MNPDNVIQRHAPSPIGGGFSSVLRRHPDQARTEADAPDGSVCRNLQTTRAFRGHSADPVGTAGTRSSVKERAIVDRAVSLAVAHVSSGSRCESVAPPSAGRRRLIKRPGQAITEDRRSRRGRPAYRDFPNRQSTQAPIASQVARSAPARDMPGQQLGRKARVRVGRTGTPMSAAEAAPATSRLKCRSAFGGLFADRAFRSGRGTASMAEPEATAQCLRKDV